MNKLQNTSLILLFLLLAIWLSPFLLVAAAIYLAYRIRRFLQRRALIGRIKDEWFPQGKCVFFLYSDSAKWKDYFEKNLIPSIQDKAIIWNWSTRHDEGWHESLLEAQLLSLFRPEGYFYPIAIVILPDGEVKTFQFYAAYVDQLKAGNNHYDKLEKEFLQLVA